MKQLEALNSNRFFCSCGIGPAANCPAPHVTRELATPGSNTRAMLILSIVAVMLLVAAYSQWR